jgi:hypothetical protein
MRPVRSGRIWAQKIKCCGCECDRDPTLAADKAKLAGKGGDDKP